MWRAGDFFSIPLEDGSFSLGQVISVEKPALNSAVCAFFSRRRKEDFRKLEPSLTHDDLLSVQFATRELLDSGVWKVFAHDSPFDIGNYLDLSRVRAARYIGTKVIGCGALRRLMNAYFGLERWDVLHDPTYLERLLVSPGKKPVSIN
jgi:hypothetical protein